MTGPATLLGALLWLPVLASAADDAPLPEPTPPPPAHDALAQRRLERAAMGTLGTWAVGNIATGAVGWSASDDPRVRGLHQGNLAWNTVNLAIAGIGLIGTERTDWHDLSDVDLGNRQVTMRRAFVINSALDVVYMGAGLGLRQWAQARDDGQKQGWGEALMLQGGFLLGFDLVMTAVQGRAIRRHRRERELRMGQEPERE